MATRDGAACDPRLIAKYRPILVVALGHSSGGYVARSASPSLEADRAKLAARDRDSALSPNEAPSHVAANVPAV